ncbi:pectin acetylesterase-family hydrolase [Ilumatobacter sp.]|uniref:pectin acetylesterase-family hydrolase n=1 Tax=Ilumatobacter sp. TaxID=1967498 RepID=UPI003C409CD3
MGKRTLTGLIAIALVAASCSSGSNSSADEGADSDSTDAEQSIDDTEPVDTEPVDTEPVDTEPVDTEPVAAEPEVASASWIEIDPESEDCACSDGSEFTFFEREGDPTKVMFYFEGGGACFNAETCDPVDGTYTPTIDPNVATALADRGGLFDVDNPENPLADYSVVYVPYCTGDVHIGDATTEYSPDLTIEHRGSPNALAALDHLAATYPDVEELFVTGASAGSVPTPLMAGLASDVLPDANIVTFGDSSGAYPDVPAINEVIGTTWGTTNAIPDWPETQGLTPSEWSFPGLYVAAGAHDPGITFGRFDYAFDEVQATFGALAGVAADDLVSLIDETEAQVEASGVPIAVYVAPGAEHTIMASDEVYAMEVDGVRLIDWITTLVTGGVPDDVHCTDCTI